jgi:hypothetical protein
MQLAQKSSKSIIPMQNTICIMTARPGCNSRSDESSLDNGHYSRSAAEAAAGISQPYSRKPQISITVTHRQRID